MRTKILILEDEEILGKLYAKKLEKADFEVKWINRIKEVEKATSDFNPEIVLLDHGINGEEQSGMDIIPNVRKIVPNAKIVMLSNYSKFHLEKKVIESGADDYLVKLDTSPNTLVKYIKNNLL